MINDRLPGYKYVCLQELLEKLPAAKEGKILADKMIDNCGTPPGDDDYDDGDDEDDGDDGDVYDDHDGDCDDGDDVKGHYDY